MGGSGKNHSPPRMATWGRGPGKPQRIRSATEARTRSSPHPAGRIAQSISLGFFVTKSRSGYPRDGGGTENKQRTSNKTPKPLPTWRKASFRKKYFFALVYRLLRHYFLEKHLAYRSILIKGKYTYENPTTPPCEKIQLWNLHGHPLKTAQKIRPTQMNNF